LNRCLLSAEAGDDAALERLLDEAGAAGNREVEVYALDALARIAAERGDRARAGELLNRADSLAPAVVHLVDDHDRLDRSRAEHLMAALPEGG
jgi:uncharacterized protein HemY